MNKKLNEKGFTLVELLATIVVLGLLATLTITGISALIKNSKEKAEEVFMQQLKEYTDDYISLNSPGISFTKDTTKNKCTGSGENKICSSVQTYKSTNTISLNDVKNAIVGKDLTNPVTEKKCNNETIQFVRDEDFVYCFTITPSEDSCIKETIDTCKDIYSED